MWSVRKVTLSGSYSLLQTNGGHSCLAPGSGSLACLAEFSGFSSGGFRFLAPVPGFWLPAGSGFWLLIPGSWFPGWAFLVPALAGSGFWLPVGSGSWLWLDVPASASAGSGFWLPAASWFLAFGWAFRLQLRQVLAPGLPRLGFLAPAFGWAFRFQLWRVPVSGCRRLPGSWLLASWLGVPVPALEGFRFLALAPAGWGTLSRFFCFCCFVCGCWLASDSRCRLTCSGCCLIS